MDQRQKHYADSNNIKQKRDLLHQSAALQSKIIQNLNSKSFDRKAGAQFTQGLHRGDGNSDLKPINRAANRDLMDPNLDEPDQEQAEEVMANNVAAAAFLGQYEGEDNEEAQRRQKRKKGQSKERRNEEGLRADAVLFDETHERGFKNTEVDWNPMPLHTLEKEAALARRRRNGHVSPDERGVGQSNKLSSAQGEATSFNRRVADGSTTRPNASHKFEDMLWEEARAIKPSLSSGAMGQVSQNYAQRHRAKHFADPHDFPQRQYEKRVQDLFTNKITQTHLSPHVIETWINDTLTDAGHLEIPGVIVKPESDKPLTRYGLQRDQLIEGKLSAPSIDRIYRALFVYSLGFYEMLNNALKNSPKKNSFQSSIWKVFSILLEYCCKTNYQMLISKIQEDNLLEMKKQDELNHLQQERMFENERTLMLKNDELIKETDNLKKLLKDETEYSRKIKEDLDFLSANHEEEVQLRLQFESKLNSLHALHRDVKAKYGRATEDIYQLEQFNAEKAVLLEQQKADLIELRSQKIANEAKIQVQDERLKHLQAELEIKIRNIVENEAKIIRLNETIDQKDFRLKESDQIFNTLRLKNEACLAQISGLEAEKQHLSLSLTENRTLKDQYYEKSEHVQRKYQDLFDKLNAIQKDVVAIDEIKRDRDERLGQLRDELDKVTTDYDELSKANSALSVQYRQTRDKLDTLSEDYEKLSSNLQVANKVRQEIEEAADKKQKDYNLLIMKYQDALKKNDHLTEENEKFYNRLKEEEKKFDSMKITKESLEKQYEIQRTQLHDKIKNLEQLLSTEKDIRQEWVVKYEHEQKAHVKTNTELLRMRSAHQDANMNLQNSKINLESLTANKKSLAEEHERLQAELSALKAKCENLEREVYSKTELLKTVENNQKFYVKRLKEDNAKIQQQVFTRVHEEQMQYEDLRTFCTKQYDVIKGLHRDIDGLNEDKRRLDDVIERQRGTIERKDEEIRLREKDVAELNRQINDLRIESAVRANEVEMGKKRIEELQCRIDDLLRQLEQIPALQKELQDAEMVKEEIKRQLDAANLELEQARAQKTEVGVQNVPETEEKEAQTEEDFQQVGYGQNQGYAQPNQYQGQNMGYMYRQSDTDSVQVAPGAGYYGAAGSISHAGMLPAPMAGASGYNFSQQNIRQPIRLGAGKNQRIQSAVNTSPSSAFVNSQRIGLQQIKMNNMIGSGALPSSTQGFTGGLNSQTEFAPKGSVGQRNVSGLASKTIPTADRYRGSNSENRYRAPLGQLQTFNAGFPGSVGQEMLIDDAVMQSQVLPRPTTGGLPQSGAFRGGQLNSSGHALSSGQTPSSVAPHALINHQAASKKSFRIRGQAEQDMMRDVSSYKDIGMDFNNDILKSVYELRQSHAALVNRPVSSQPFAGNRRNIQSAVARQPQQMAFGGYMIPSGADALNQAISGENFNMLSEQNQILEIDELQSDKGRKKAKSKFEKKPPISRQTTVNRLNSSGDQPLRPHKMQVGIQVSPGSGAQDQTATLQGGQKYNLNSHNNLHLNADMTMSGQSLPNMQHMYGVRSHAEGIAGLDSSSQPNLGFPAPKQKLVKESQSKGIKKLIKLASSND